MKELSKLAKFFIICGVVFVVGLICTIAGMATGGPEDIDKLAEKYDWIQGEPGERGVTTYPVEDFDSVAITGDCDVWMVGKEYYKNASRLADDDLLTASEIELTGKNKVLVIAGDKVEQPKISVTDGVLNINGGALQEESGVSLNFSGESWTPRILVCCPKEPLESMTMSSDYADLTCLGTAWKNAKIEVNGSDITMEGVESAGLQMDMESADCDLEGKFIKTTSINTESGDVNITTSLPKAEYGLDLETESGDIVTGEGEDIEDVEDSEDIDDIDEEDGSDMHQLKVNGGPHTISVKSESGDIKVLFGN